MVINVYTVAVYSTNDVPTRATALPSYTLRMSPDTTQKTSPARTVKETPPTAAPRPVSMAPAHTAPPRPLDNTGIPTPAPVPVTTRRQRPFRRRKPTTRVPTTTATDYVRSSSTEWIDDEEEPTTSTEDTPSTLLESSFSDNPSIKSQPPSDKNIDYLWTPAPTPKSKTPTPKYPDLPPPVSSTEADVPWWRRKTTQYVNPTRTSPSAMGGRREVTSPVHTTTVPTLEANNSSVPLFGKSGTLFD